MWPRAHEESFKNLRGGPARTGQQGNKSVLNRIRTLTECMGNSVGTSGAL